MTTIINILVFFCLLCAFALPFFEGQLKPENILLTAMMGFLWLAAMVGALDVLLKGTWTYKSSITFAHWTILCGGFIFAAWQPVPMDKEDSLKHAD